MITYSLSKKISAEELRTVFKSSGIRRPINDLQRLKRMLDNANLLVTAWHDEELIGVLRGLSDYSYCTFIADFAIKKEFQGQGTGREMLTFLREKQDKTISTLLLSAPTAETFYQKNNFEQVPTGFSRLRKY